MAARADRTENDEDSREERDGRAPAPVTHPPRPVRGADVGDVIRRGVEKHREALEILAKR